VKVDKKNYFFHKFAKALHVVKNFLQNFHAEKKDFLKKFTLLMTFLKNFTSLRISFKISRRKPRSWKNSRRKEFLAKFHVEKNFSQNFTSKRISRKIVGMFKGCNTYIPT
jgi:hypothetical protein